MREIKKQEGHKLSNKQLAFIEEYITCWNASEAARRAGYSNKTARQIGAENLTKPVINKAIKARLADLQMSADEVLVRLTEQARGSMSDFVDTKTATIDLRKAERNNKLHLLKSFTRTVGKETDTVRVEIHDAQAALALLAKVHKLLIDKSESSSSVDYVIRMDR